MVGGGVFGVTAALELRKRGRDVSLFDPGRLPRPEASSTDISKAVRMDYGDDVLYTEMAEHGFPVWESWNGSWGEELYHEDGFLFLTREPMVPGGFEHESFQLLEERGHRLERMNPQLLRRRHPQWAAELATYLVRVDHDDMEARIVKANSFRKLGYAQININWRNWYLTSAMELEGKIDMAKIGPKMKAVFLSPDMMKNLPALPAARYFLPKPSLK